MTQAVRSQDRDSMEPAVLQPLDPVEEQPQHQHQQVSATSANSDIRDYGRGSTV